MNINSGFKAVDKLAMVHGLACEHIDNPFQLAVDIPDETIRYEIRNLIKPFGLRDIPHSMWLALQANLPATNGMSLHRFSLPHLNKVICWVLVNAKGKIIEKAFPMNKPLYTDAAKVLIESLTSGYAYCNMQFQVAA